ncbi:MAG: DEAD/DEAH box helicase [Oscillospiraceae bacterium]
MTFQQLGLLPQILTALEEQGYSEPTPIQRGAIPPALKGQDVLGCAQTGTGKTCAFAAPILQRLTNTHKKGPRSIRALILTPTRELALQIEECFEAYGKHLPLRCAVIFGGVGQQPQVDKIKQGLDILVATPGRLLDLHGQGLLDLSHIEIFVLDEADRMLDMGFIHDVRRVLKLLPERKQTLFFSATMPPEVMELVNALLHNYARVEVDPVSSPVEVIAQSIYFVDKGNKTKLLAHLIEEKAMDSVLVFSRTKHGANRIAQDLIKRGITAAAIHGNKSQTARQQALADFKAGKVTALIATDIAARGIDIDELNWVVNYDLPEVPETYVHRIGRTGRAGREGTALSFCRADEMDYLKAIEKLLGRKLPVTEDHPYPMVESATGVDPMVQARREGKENARARAAERRKAQAAQAAEAPAPKKPAPKAVKAKEPARPKEPPKAQEPKKKAEPPKKAEPQKAKAVPKAEVPGKAAPKRGVRQQRLEDTLPTRPVQASGDFVRPDPFASDRIMDATARLLAPRPRTAQPRQEQPEQPRRKKQPSKGNTPVGNQAAPAPKQNIPAKQKKPEPIKEKTAAPKAEAAPASGSKKRSRSRRSDRPRPVELKRSHVKDSTEQPSLMKPYYLNDD